MSSPQQEVAAAFSRRLQARRAELGWTIRKVADKTGLAYSTAWNADNGAKDIALSTAVRIAAALELSLDGLLGSPGDGAA